MSNTQSATSANRASAIKYVILISGGGSNLQAFIDRSQSGALSGNIAAVVSNRADAAGLQRASAANIATEVLDHRAFPSREHFDAQLTQVIDRYQPDLVILAGFMRILTPAFVDHYQGRLMNVHPSLLPKYPGLNTHQRAIDAGDSHSGATVHFVTEQLDGGPPIIQASVPIAHNDSPATLAARTLQCEHVIYPMAAQWFAEGRLQLDNQCAILDHTTLPANGYQYPQ